MAEYSGLIVPIGAHVIRRACEEFMSYVGEGAGADQIGLSVNLSPRQLSDPDLLATVREALTGSGLAADRLTLEVTESMLIDGAAGTAQTVAELRAMGVSISIDDFGTGYSSLNTLRQLTADVLKIDKSFVDDIATDPNSAHLARTIIQLANDLGLQTVAEGVEDIEQLDQLRSLGCELIQGFYFAKPMPSDEMARYIAQSTAIHSVSSTTVAKA